MLDKLSQAISIPSLHPIPLDNGGTHPAPNLPQVELGYLYLSDIYLSVLCKAGQGESEDVGWMNNQDFWIEQFASSL